MPFGDKKQKLTSYQKKAQTQLEQETLGVSPEDARDIEQITEIAQAEAQMAAQAEALPKPQAGYILQEIQSDKHNKIRRYVKLTPSMCTVKGCGFDSAKLMGFTAGWDDPKLFREHKLPNGVTIGAKLTEMVKEHVNTAHILENSHLISEEEFKEMQSRGSGGYLTGAR